MPRPVTLVEGDAPERVMGADVSPGYFRLLGVTPFLGRDFDSADAAADLDAVVLSHGFWMRRFGQWSVEGFRSLENRTPLPA